MSIKTLKTDTVRARVEPKLKRQAEAVLKHVGVTPSDAITMFLHQVVLQKGLPFETRIPNAASRAAIQEARDPAKRAKMKVYTGSTKDIFDNLLKSGK